MGCTLSADHVLLKLFRWWHKGRCTEGGASHLPRSRWVNRLRRSMETRLDEDYFALREVIQPVQQQFRDHGCPNLNQQRVFRCPPDSLRLDAWQTPKGPLE